jgi:hypothetical protein
VTPSLASISAGALAALVIAAAGLLLVVVTMCVVSRPTRVRYCHGCGWLEGAGHALGCDGRYGYWVPRRQV